jgi:hypothetical protein
MMHCVNEYSVVHSSSNGNKGSGELAKSTSFVRYAEISIISI